MVPQIKARFRKRSGIPYAFERFTGHQYRCRLCNAVFYNEQKFESHLNAEVRLNAGKKVDKKCPKINESVMALIYYSEDILNAFKAVNVKRFKKGEVYDGGLRRK